MSTKVEFCGAFNGTVSVRYGETIEQLHDRIESAIQSALDRSCKRLDVSIGVDMGDLEAAFNSPSGRYDEPAAPDERITP